MGKIIKPENYKPLLNPAQTEQGIKLIKDFFQSNLSTELRLRRVTAPLFVLRGLGINDDLNGVERPVSFPIKDMGEQVAEVVHSLAKWKRLMLAEYQIQPGYGLYTDMNASGEMKSLIISTRCMSTSGTGAARSGRKTGTLISSRKSSGQSILPSGGPSTSSARLILRFSLSCRRKFISSTVRNL